MAVNNKYISASVSSREIFLEDLLMTFSSNELIFNFNYQIADGRSRVKMADYILV